MSDEIVTKKQLKRLEGIEHAASDLLRYMERNYEPEQWDASTRDLMEELRIQMRKETK